VYSHRDRFRKRIDLRIGKTRLSWGTPNYPIQADRVHRCPPGSGTEVAQVLPFVTLNSMVNHRGGSKRPKVRNLMARLILSSCLGLVLLGSASAIAEPSPGSDLSGVYACEGTNPDGSAYTAVVEIVKRQDTYLVRWTQENEEQVMGVGIQQDGVLAVSYFGGAPAIVVYSLATEGRLTGQWTMGGAGRLFKETLTKVSAVDVDTKPAKPARRSK
jgi:hypothetical protein